MIGHRYKVRVSDTETDQPNKALDQQRLYFPDRFVIGFRDNRVYFFTRDEEDLLREAEAIKNESYPDFEYHGKVDVDDEVVGEMGILGRNFQEAKARLGDSSRELMARITELSI